MEEQILPASPATIDTQPIAPLASPNNPPWSGWTGAVVWAASVAAILVLPTVFLAVYGVATGFDMNNREMLVEFATRDRGAIISQILAIFPAHIATLALAWAMVTKLGERPFFATLGWHHGGVRWWHYVVTLFAFLVITAAATSVFPIREDDMERVVRSSRTALYLVAAMAVFTAPLVEEVVYRGILYSPFHRRFGAASAVILVTVLFAAVHVPQYYENPAKILVIVLLSLVLTIVRAMTGSLLPCFILHLAINSLNALLLIAEPYLQPTALDPAQSIMAMPGIFK